MQEGKILSRGERGQHFVGLLWIGPENEGPSVGELDVSALQFGREPRSDVSSGPSSRSASSGKNANGTNAPLRSRGRYTIVGAS